MTVKEIIKRLEELDKGKVLWFYSDLGFIYTSDFECFSWRGSYELPAVEATLINNTGEGTPVEVALENLRECNGMGVIGYKGGDFVLSEDDTLFIVPSISDSGNCVGITSIEDNGRIHIKADMY